MSDAAGMNHWIDPNGIVHVVFDRPDDKVNLLTPDTLSELSELLDSVRGREDVRGLIFASAKPGNFIAGMDIEVIASFTDAFKAAEGARLGQTIFQKIADLPVPTAAAINGSAAFFPTLGGALVIVVFHRVLGFGAYRWRWVGFLVKGVPEIIVENGERRHDGMRRNHISDHDLEEDLRLSAHTDDLSKIRIARIERSGDISFIKKQPA
jgi:hypothetical protein